MPNVRLAVAAALALAAAAPGPTLAGPRGAIDDDYPRALAAARARGVPVVVDVWAPW
jgi:hypothetical protein